jgi:hypothetical protein
MRVAAGQNRNAGEHTPGLQALPVEAYPGQRQHVEVRGLHPWLRLGQPSDQEDVPIGLIEPPGRYALRSHRPEHVRNGLSDGSAQNDAQGEIISAGLRGKQTCADRFKSGRPDLLEAIR